MKMLLQGGEGGTNKRLPLTALPGDEAGPGLGDKDFITAKKQVIRSHRSSHLLSAGVKVPFHSVLASTNTSPT